jgi:hypothetical protein
VGEDHAARAERRAPADAHILLDVDQRLRADIGVIADGEAGRAIDQGKAADDRIAAELHIAIAADQGQRADLAIIAQRDLPARDRREPADMDVPADLGAAEPAQQIGLQERRADEHQEE